MKGVTVFTAITIVALSAVATPARAGIVHFVNPEPGQPGHYAWHLDLIEPPSWLDITLSPQAQTNLPNGNSVVQLAGSFGNLHHPEPGSPGQHALVLADLGSISFTAALSFGDPVQAGPGQDFLASTAHVGVGDDSNFAEGVPLYIGVLTMDGHYGWIEVVRDDFTFTALSWAYQTKPGVAIYAGQIPAPGALALLGIGLFGVGNRSRMRS